MSAPMANAGHVPKARMLVRPRSFWSAALAVTALLVTARPSVVLAQRDTRERRVGGVPREVTLEVTRVYNAPGTRRVHGDFSLAAGDTVRSDLAVLNGAVRIAGVVTGQVVALNSDVRLLDGARVEQSLTVIGGTFDGPERPTVGGEIRVWSSRYRYREDADTLIAETDLFARWSRWVREENESSTQSQLFVTTAHTYNRVEGLPIFVGPRVRVKAGTTRVSAEAFGIFRTGDQLVWKRENLGHRAMLELRQGQRTGFAVGGRLFDEVAPVENWQLTDAEVGLNSFLFTRDYRDFYQRHGGQGYVSVFGALGTELRAGIGEERWSSRRARDVWSLFNDNLAWRANPLVDEGVLHLFTLSGTLDTRNRKTNPRSGWYLRGEYERGTGDLTSAGPLTTGVRTLTAGPIEYGRALFDLRRYTRLGPRSQVNLRAVFGGWTDGDPLPIQRRLAVSGLDALPGFDFRRMIGSADIGTCATGAEGVYAALGRPAQCDRMALLQIEWKGDIRLRFFGDDDFGDRRWSFGSKADGTWVIFANSGRGWLVGNTTGSTNADELRYARNTVPAIGTWRTDIGGGFDFGDFGVYVAQAVSQSGLSPNVYVRLARRF
ncbi:MAG: hypothetical protein K2R93_09295 [Gemmatimonadaceae bacterium]|nr:hypothetical protein [Gemmatimonadaceae bacterium]